MGDEIRDRGSPSRLKEAQGVSRCSCTEAADKGVGANCFKGDASRALGSAQGALPVDAMERRRFTCSEGSRGQVRRAEHLVDVRARLEENVDFVPRNFLGHSTRASEVDQIEAGAFGLLDENWSL
jgi:hypothetical protein